MHLPGLQKNSSQRIQIILFTSFLVLLLMPSCRLASSNAAASATMTHDADMNSMHTEESDGHDTSMREFIPNDGVEVHIAIPANEASFKAGETVPVTIETTGFTIGENGNHWHIYLDGRPIMVMGGYTYVLQDLSAGQHVVEVYLSNGQHQDLEEGDIVTITVEE